jgi:predicted metal-dependent phosphoesterase TrpH
MTEFLKVDLHSHTWYSADSLTSPERLIARARAAQLDRIAVTDHDAIDGALEAHARAPDLVIVGEEIRCACLTEVIGLFLQSWIPGGMSLEETAAAIREQNGVVFIPHPFAYLRGGAEKAAKALPYADIVEVFNSRAFYPDWNRKAKEQAARREIPEAACSDSHFPWEFGRAYTEMPYFNDAQSFLAAAANARAVAVRKANPLIHCASISIHAARRLLRRGHGTRPWQPAKLPPRLAG